MRFCVSLTTEYTRIHGTTCFAFSFKKAKDLKPMLFVKKILCNFLVFELNKSFRAHTSLRAEIQ